MVRAFAFTAVQSKFFYDAKSMPHWEN